MLADLFKKLKNNKRCLIVLLDQGMKVYLPFFWTIKLVTKSLMLEI